jgi:hypothetical protein
LQRIGIGDSLSQLETEATMRIAASPGSGGRRDADPLPQRNDPQRPLLPAIIPSTRRVNAAGTPAARPAAALLAQLVAAVENLPIARARRRADAQTSAELYRSVANLKPVPRSRTSRIF